MQTTLDGPGPGAGRLWRGPAAFTAAPAYGPWTSLLLAAAIVAAGTFASILLVHFEVVPQAKTAEEDTAILLLLAWQICVVALVLILTAARRPVAALSLHRPAAGPVAYAAALALLLGYQVVITAAEYALVPGQMFRDLKPFVEMARGPMWLVALAVVAIGAPLSEELLFRGFLLPALARSRVGFAGAALVTSTLWTTLHFGYSVVGLLEVFATGLLLSWLLWRTGSLRVTIACHAVYNGLIMLALRYLPLPSAVFGQSP